MVRLIYLSLALGVVVDCAVAFSTLAPSFIAGGRMSIPGRLGVSNRVEKGVCGGRGLQMMGYPPGISYEPLPGSGAAPMSRGISGGFQRLSPVVAPPSPSALRGTTKLFLDTADQSAWSEQLPLGIFTGITTNPILLERAGVECSVKSMDSLSATAFGMGADEFMCQAWGDSVAQLVGIGADLARLDPRIVVKLPLTAEGIQAANVLTKRGARICMTACYTPHQVVTSSALGAEYVAPYLGRMEDAGRGGLESCQQMQEVLVGLGSDTRLLVASIRDASQIALLAAKGCDTFTFSPDVSKQLSGNYYTAEAAKEFEAAAGRMASGGATRGKIGFAI